MDDSRLRDSYRNMGNRRTKQLEQRPEDKKLQGFFIRTDPEQPRTWRFSFRTKKDKIGGLGIRKCMTISPEVLRSLGETQPATLAHLSHDIQQTEKERIPDHWDPNAFSTRHRGELFPQFYEEKRSTKMLVASEAGPEEVTIDRRKEKRWAMRALEKRHKLSDEILEATLAEAVGMIETETLTSECLPMINQRSKWFDDQQALQEGDSAFVDEGKNRGSWRRSVIEAVIKGSDGRVQHANVRTANDTV
nr:uncharacterized protein LOC109403718 [Aedes albopictus]XP_029709925.1 uncharacterized protein LOC109403718 [Aedes albopictus]XP_029709928.1 uncharacterized protein LOC109403718 [Aedes albopictus]